ncbi:hypothetical protein I7I51_08185 [Histoplasma capsulatum]|uniref:HTH psq-type domain-containing protein n=1 Tax=Ajellomyces capsulatus TaxID=5037 RepID=A0A8A1LX72_AJECA|nr:hypothetical protein I7I51_08185 [Histoplasma capsulatum]
MSNKDKTIEERMQKAVTYHQKNPNSKILPLSREFEVPYQRLRARINGRNPNTAKTPVNKSDCLQRSTLIEGVIAYKGKDRGSIEKVGVEALCREGRSRSSGKQQGVEQKPKVDRGPSLSHMEFNEQQITELENYLNISKHYRAKTTHHQVQVEKVLTIKDANRKIKQCKDNEAEKEQNRMRWRLGELVP